MRISKTVLITLLVSSTAFAANKFPEGNFEKSMKAAFAKHRGQVLSVEA